MNICPRIEVDSNKLRHNTEIIVGLCKKNNIQSAAVTKVFCGIPEIAEAIVQGGVNMLADSRIDNLKKLAHLKIPKLLLRLPMQSRIAEVVKYADISLNSEIATIEKISKEAVRQNKVHNIILMIDLGDLREGVWESDAVGTAGEILKLDGINLMGIGTNLTCYGGVIPSKENLGLLSEVATRIEKEFEIKLEIISGGNSSSIYLLQREEMPEKINHLRPGEAIVLGTESAYGEIIKDTYQDVFTFVGEIIELKEKQSIPIGKIGVDAFGNKPTFVDRGVRKRAIIAVGRQDVQVEHLKPIDENMMILGASSDHCIIDITDADKDYAVGDEIRFGVDYGALLQLMTSEYIHKVTK
ncbi:ornithine racemase Orr [Marinisporobacter balticus]|uniref:Putative amino acid racemase n=1 Tax=Marinisporobacter balticus TaxID=2018667 RepID=A0A4R2LIA2_9FIRM|nr:ornithine racemase Orr [Marinisporobacter balticus]TCO79045.1 putative amino acid racemase [Marinisporobacter balticus]